MADSAGEITILLARLRDGDREAESRLIPLVYNELRKMARARLRAERSDHSLQSTDLVHEAYLSLVAQRDKKWQNRTHFMAVASTQMRRILVDHARAHGAEKRGGGQAKVNLDEALIYTPEKSARMLALDEALDHLAQFDARQAQAVEMYYFGGLCESEVAELLGRSTRTVKRDLKFAKAWLSREMERGASRDAAAADQGGGSAARSGSRRLRDAHQAASFRLSSTR